MEFNPNFTFDAGEVAAQAQAPWEFSGALKQALKDNNMAKPSTIDDKIQKQLQARKAKGLQAEGKKRGRAQMEECSDEDDSEAEEQEDGDDVPVDEADEDSESSEEEDQPLPGELSDDDDEGEGGSEDEEESDDKPEQSGSDESDSDTLPPQRTSGGAAQKTSKTVEQQRQRQQQKQQQEEDEDKEEDGGESEEAGSDDDGDDGEAQRIAKRQRTNAGASTSQAAVNGSAGGAAAGTKQGRPGKFYAETPEGTRFSAGSFADLNLSRPLLRACSALGYTQPTPIQAACIPLALSGRDICGSAMTGSGKTAAFALPILERLLYRTKQVQATYVLILTPTRELAVQIHSMIGKLAQFTDISAALIVGGLSLSVQAATLRKGPEIVVATPGRMIDHLRNTQSFGLEDLVVLVLDEADRLLEMGFKEEIMEIVKMAPKKRQTMLFSATLNEGVRQLMALSLKAPVRLAADAAATAPKLLSQEVVRLKGGQSLQKEAMLLSLCSRSFRSGRTIVFCRTKQRAHRMKVLFGLCQLPPAGELHGDMTQAARLDSLERFRLGEVKFLLATDVAARGLDILGVETVINFDAPRTLESYLHRIGRTARAGASGLAVTFAEDGDRPLLKEVVKRGRVNLKQRLVPPQAVSQWQSKLERLEPEVLRVQIEEREEKELRKAEMEAAKMQNLIDHESEIFSRPARSWFQTEREKREGAKRAKAASNGQLVEGDEDAQAGASQPKERKDKRNERLKEKRAAKTADTKANRRNTLQEETDAFSKNIKSAKSRIRALVQQGVPAAKAGKIAAAAVTGTSAKRQKKGSKGSLQSKDQQLFSGDGIHSAAAADGTAAAAGAGGGTKQRGGRDARKANGLSKTELSRLKRKGKGHKAFKSAKKFKRR